uniref:C-type lectin domain-containing protein n=1 Tax=Panagrolaimus sp. JU765 TaxID=591449 RepID=A0AC34QHL4_9BILA
MGAREHCLTQNSDLITISSKEELDWVLRHYEPQFSNVNERMIQIGLFIDSQNGHKEWRWVDHSALKDDLLEWVTGEPFDHTDGRERCSILRVNEKKLDDIDCDLGGSSTKMFRFICQRTNEEHIEHEAINNPLWKKLQDILDFFGISGNKEENTSKPGEDEEDYWEIQANLTTTAITESQNLTETASVADELEGSGEDPVITNPDIKPNVIQGAKTVENSIIEDELIVDKNLAKLDGKEKAEHKTDANEKNVEAYIVETTRTTKPDPLEKLEKIKVNYVDILEKNMEKLERIVDAVEKMIDPSDALKVVDDEVSEAEQKHNDKQEMTPEKLNLNMAIKEAEQEEQKLMEAMENDFNEALNDTNKILEIDELSTTNNSSELCDETEEESKTEKIKMFLTTLSKYLHQSSPENLKVLLEESKADGESLIKKLNSAVLQQEQQQKGNNTENEQKLNSTLIENESSDNSTTDLNGIEKLNDTTEENPTNNNVTDEKSQPSVFPVPDFDLVKSLNKIPESVIEDVKKDKKKVDAAYEEFNRRIDTSNLLKKIEQTEKVRQQQLRPLPILPTMTSQLEKSQNDVEKIAVRELEKMFEDLGRNFKALVDG